MLILCSFQLFVRAATPEQKRADQVKIGIVAYDNFESKYAKYEAIFRKISADARTQRNRYVFFHIAIGTYSEVLDWYNKRLIDVAILTPGPAARILSLAGQAGKVDGSQLSEVYLATNVFKNVDKLSILAQDDRKDGRTVVDYRTACVVRKDSGINGFADIQRLWREHKLTFVFVDPLSISGYVLPAHALKIRDIEIRESDGVNVQWSTKHSNSIDALLRDQDDGRIRVAFVSDDTYDPPEEKDDKSKAEAARSYAKLREMDEKLKLVDVPGVSDEQWLGDIKIPQTVALLNHNLEPAKFKRYKEIVGKYLNISERNKTGIFKFDTNWSEKFQKVQSWMSTISSKAEHKRSAYLKLGELIESIHGYNDYYKDDNPIRLAVVLSGGGAKCAYQLGALKAIETALAADDPRPPRKKLSIDLVVGTSGGAINAFAAGLDLSGKADFLEIWKGFNQASFFQPWGTLAQSFGLVLGAIEVFLIVFLSTRFELRNKWKRAVLWLFALAVLQATVVFTPFRPGTWPGFPGNNHFTLHSWLLIKMICSWTLPFLILSGVIVGIAGLGYGRIADRTGRIRGIGLFQRRRFRRSRLGRLITATAVVLMIVILWLPFQNIKSLSSHGGMEREFADKLPALLSTLGNDLDLSNATDDKARLAAMSHWLVSGKKFKRDLVITASRISPHTGEDADDGSSHALPDDLYFYYPKGEKPVDDRFISFTDNPDKVLDVVIGSSSIYPVFPTREIRDVKRGPDQKVGQTMEIIDGGFAHNTPIDAAISWGATHIIVIEVSAQEPSSNTTFYDNTIAAFSYLFYQAQQIDTLAKGKVEIYELRPACLECSGEKAYTEQQAKTLQFPRYNLDTFDFESTLVDFFSRKGENDAGSNEHARFRRITGEPRFREALPPITDPKTPGRP